MSSQPPNLDDLRAQRDAGRFGGDDDVAVLREERFDFGLHAAAGFERAGPERDDDGVGVDAAGEVEAAAERAQVGEQGREDSV